METMTCVVIASSEDIRQILAASLHALGVDSILLESLGELPATLHESAACGILLELTSAIRATPQEKVATQEWIELFPFAKFKVIDHEIRIAGKSLEVFVDECHEFNPRVIRKSPRRVGFLGVYLSPDGDFDTAEKTITTNISDQGYFIYSSREWTVGDRVWLRFPGNECDVCGTVRSWQQWGNNKTIPGIGVEVDPGKNCH